ncbi:MULTISPECIES: helix-turn-helix domain-containing protein [unclassified Staphylococcus]|uniref:helix-turn-helix domain-containing protein n=1 Tax=unclassified Staphylococcus TaxID=91994 RepID=UPI00194F60B6|nr:MULTISPECIES: helix-turn-helix domain-containing protein [unclassified Staphylococcus]
MKTELEVYTVNDVAKSLDMHIETVREYIKRGELKASKVGRKYIITLDNYKDFIKANENKA